MWVEKVPGFWVRKTLLWDRLVVQLEAVLISTNQMIHFAWKFDGKQSARMSCHLMSCSHCGRFPAQTFQWSKALESTTRYPCGKLFPLEKRRSLKCLNPWLVVLQWRPRSIPIRRPKPLRCLQRLMEIVGEENLRTAVRKLGDKGLDLMAEYQDHFTDEWTALVTPLHLAASGDFVETQVNSFVRNALEVYRKHGPVVWMFGMFSLHIQYIYSLVYMLIIYSYSYSYSCECWCLFLFVKFAQSSSTWGVAEHDLQRTLPCALQQTVMKAIKGCLDEIVSQKVASPQFVEIHKNIICDGCGSVSIKEFNPYR